MSLQPVPIQNVPGVPDYTCTAFLPKSSDYCLLIPVINEGSRILTELGRAQKAGVDRLVDIVICDGGSTDGSMNPDTLELYGVNTLLVKTGPGKQGAQLRMGLHFALTFGYKGVLTIDGNNKDSIEDVPEFVAKLKEGYDLVQGSRFIPGGHAINTPKTRYAAVRLIHAPIISAAAHQWFTDTTNAYRAYSREYLTHPDVQPLRDVFMGYELLAYLSIRATQLGLRACEVPVTRAYPASGKTPTKISGFKGNSNLLQVLFAAATGKYNPYSGMGARHSNRLSEVLCMTVDKIIIGAGLYGLYAAQKCGAAGQRVLVLERDPAPFMRATYINQARVHMGYHYPRSYSTAIKSAHYFQRFCRDYDFCLHTSFDQIYATSAHFSWTNAAEFRRFCAAAKIRCDDVAPERYFNNGMCDGAFLTTEYTYDAQVLKNWFLEQLAKLPNVQVLYSH